MKGEKYSAASELLVQEGQLFWQTFSGFLLAHTVFVAFILQALSTPPLLASRPGLLVAACLGLLLCVPWMASHSRSAAYHRFRMAQARAAEPRHWKLLRSDGERFAKGDPVTIEGQLHHMPWMARQLRTTRSVRLLIASFMAAYALVAVMSWPSWKPARPESEAPENSYQVTSYDASSGEWGIVYTGQKAVRVRIAALCDFFQQTGHDAVRGKDSCDLLVGETLIPNLLPKNPAEFLLVSRGGNKLTIVSGDRPDRVQQQFSIISARVEQPSDRR